MKKTNDKREYRRVQAILRKCEGRTYKAIAKEHGVDERTIQRWIADYIKKGIEGLTIRKSSGSKPRITDKDREIVLSALFNDPHIFGYLRNTWSLRSLAKKYGVILNGENVISEFTGNRLTEGYIGIQNHDVDSHVSFKNIRIPRKYQNNNIKRGEGIHN